MRLDRATWAVALGLLTAVAAPALGNGRPAGTSTINFRLGSEQHVAAGMTFGLLLSNDGGATWRWMCEDAVEYGGTYDPDYAYAMGGALFATTFDGPLVNRNGCTFDPTPVGTKFVASTARGPDNAIYLGMVHPPNPAIGDPGDAAIYRSTDEGATFDVSPSPAPVGTWWNSIEVAPSLATRVYASGYLLNMGNREFSLFRSEDGGTSYVAMTAQGLTMTRNSTIDIVGISKLDPDNLYVRISFQDEESISDAIFAHTDGGRPGTPWVKIFEQPSELAFVVRANGDLVVGSKDDRPNLPDVRLSVSRHPSNGQVWEPLTGAPHINCLVENGAGEVWACTQNFGIPQIPSDGAGIMKSSNLTSWTPVLRYQNIAGPVDCAPGTEQRNKCVDEAPSQWCSIKRMFGITADPTQCPVLVDAGIEGDITTITPPGRKGCCDNSAAPSSSGVAIAALVGILVLRPRRRRARRC